EPHPALSVFHHSLSLSSTFFFSDYGHHPDLHSFPTRRSSDLTESRSCIRLDQSSWRSAAEMSGTAILARAPPSAGRFTPVTNARSEEHTSELQSLRHLVCRLLLEKKKKNRKNSEYENADRNYI